MLHLLYIINVIYFLYTKTLTIFRLMVSNITGVTMKKTLLLIISTVFIMTSCYKQTIYLNSDKKSGSMIIEYSLDDDTFQMISMVFMMIEPEEGSFVPDPMMLIDEDTFKSTFPEDDNFKLKSVDLKMSTVYEGRIEIEFNDFQDALKKLPMQSSGFIMKEDKGHLLLEQTVDLDKIDPDRMFLSFLESQKQDDKEFYNKIVNNSPFQFEINTKTPMQSAEGFKLSQNNKKATYTFKLSDILSNKQGLKFSLKL